MKRKFLSIILILSIILSFAPVVSNAAASDVTKLINVIKQYGTVNSNGSISLQDKSYDNGYTIATTMTYRSSDNIIIFHFNMSKQGLSCTISFDYDIASQKAKSNKISANYLNDSTFSSVLRQATFDIGSYTQNSTLNFTTGTINMNPPSNINETFNDITQAAVASWNKLCYQKAGISIDKIGFDSYYSSNVPSPTPTSKPTPTPTPIVQCYPDTNIPTYTYITNRSTLGISNNVYCYSYYDTEFYNYMEKLKTDYGFNEYYKEVLSDITIYYLTNNKYSILIGYSPEYNMVAITFCSSIPTITAVITKSETDTTYDFDVTPEAAYNNCYVYAAVYDASGILLTANRVPLETSRNTSISVDKKDNAATAKVFIWTDTLQPITTAEEISLDVE